MIATQQLFPAESQTMGQILHRGGASFGYRIPDYQRPYTWSKPELQRLVDDSLERFLKLAEDESTFNFLGTIILADDQSTESTFTGQSQLVVDGQQRLITLSLTCMVMEQLILDAKRNYQPGPRIKEWIDLECRDVVNQLFACTNGAMQSGIDSYFFPRITRSTDFRSSMDEQHEYASDIAKCLWGFTEFHRAASTRYERPYSPNPEIKNVVSQNYEYLISQLSTYFFNDVSRRHRLDLESRQLGKEEFRRRGVKQLLRRGHIVGDTTAVDKAIAQVTRSPHGVVLLRIVLFARFLLERLVITKIETSTEEQAFDIFDALNTTGLPLTAVETLKPLVVAFERDAPRLDGVECRERFTIVENYLNDPSLSSSARQSATKDVVTGFALYYRGDRIGYGLSAQRQYLRRTFSEAMRQGSQYAMEHVTSLADIADFRDRFWRLGDITEISNIHAHDIEELDQLLLCLAFIRATGTKLAIPILATYWRRSKENRGVSFPRAAKSIAAFIALRRAMTGGTARIEERFRSVMGNQNVLERDADSSNESLNRLLLGLLRTEPDPVVSKSQWLNRAKSVAVPRNSSSSAVAKFMLLAAAHNSDPLRNGLWDRGSRLPSDEKSYLTHGTWSSARYRTVEHIAPQSRNVEGWDPMIYADPSTVGMLGNQVLLPQRENASVGKASWRKKKAYYSALAADTPERRAKLIRGAQDLGVDFPPQTIKLVSGQARLRMLDPIVNVNQWTEDLIRSRTENVLNLSWDSLAPWIDGLN